LEKLRKNTFETFASLTRRRDFSHVFNLSLSLLSLSFSLFFSLLAGAFSRAAYYQSGNKAGVY
jgi:hypothetical protein